MAIVRGNTLRFYGTVTDNLGAPLTLDEITIVVRYKSRSTGVMVTEEIADVDLDGPNYSAEWDSLAARRGDIWWTVRATKAGSPSYQADFTVNISANEPNLSIVA